MKRLAHNDRVTSRERVIAAFNHEMSDRVPVNYMSNPGIDKKLKQYFDLSVHVIL